MAARSRNLFGGGGLARLAPWLMLLPGLGFYLLIGVGPSLATFIYSITDATGIRGIPINWVGFDNYNEFLFEGARSRDNLDALRRTLIFMFLVTTIQFGVGLVMALLVNQNLRGRLVFRTLFFVPVILGRGRAGSDVEAVPPARWRSDGLDLRLVRTWSRSSWPGPTRSTG